MITHSGGGALEEEQKEGEEELVEVEEKEETNKFKRTNNINQTLGCLSRKWRDSKQDWEQKNCTVWQFGQGPILPGASAQPAHLSFERH
jgi:hypothetical protein